MKLIKYTKTDHGIESLSSGEFKITRPLDENDPFEMLGARKGRLSDKARKEFVDDVAYAWTKKAMSSPKLASLRPIGDVRADAWAGAERAIDEQILGRSVFQRTDRILSVVDADRIDDRSDQLMWAHYAGSGSGMRIWIDDSKMPEEYPDFYRVNYSDERPCLDLDKVGSWDGRTVFGELVGQCLLTKSEAWSYECEWRMIVTDRIRPDLLTRHVGKSGKELEFVKIPLSAVVRVDFGPKAYQNETKILIEKLKSNPALQHVEMRIAVFHPTRYKYVYTEMD